MRRLPHWCDDARVFDIPLTTRFRGISRRQGMLLHGEQGWAEWSPFPEYGVPESGTWLECAAEVATLPAPDARRSVVPVNAIVPAVDAATAAHLVLEAGASSVKVKVAQAGQGIDDDVERVAAVRDALGADGRVRVDANGAWGLDEAEFALRRLAAFDLEFAEQPVADVSDLARLRARLAPVGVRIAADESIRRSGDPHAVARFKAADVIVIKVQPLGGIRRCLALVEELGLPVVVSSAVETSVGLAVGLRLAAALPELEFACGLGTGRLLAGDVAEPLVASGGELAVREVSVDPALLDRWEAGDDVADWWFGRLAEVLESQQ